MQDGSTKSGGHQNGFPPAAAVNAAPGLSGPIESDGPRTLASEAPDATTASATVRAASPDALADDHNIYGEEEDAQSFIQPTISPMATRLSLPRTPAAEKAMAMDQRISNSTGGAFFDAYKPAVASRLHSATISTPSYTPAAPVPVPASKPTALASVFQSGTRHGRSSSVGSDALKRLSKALPSMPSWDMPTLSSISFPSPSSFLPNLNTASFFSSSSGGGGGATVPTPSSPPPSQKMSPRGSPTRADSQRAAGAQRSFHVSQVSDPDQYSGRQPSSATAAAFSRTASSAVGSSDTLGRPPLNRPPSVASRQSYALRQSTSDNSLLYHTLSRASSHGDEGQFGHVREQVNSRVKAIMDSFDRPTFKMPQMPSTYH